MDVKPSRSVYAPDLIPSVLYGYLSTEGLTMLIRFPGTWCPRRQVQRKLCGTIFSRNIENLWVLCYSGNSDRDAWALFVKHPRVYGLAQGEWLRQNPGASQITPTQSRLLPHNRCSSFNDSLVKQTLTLKLASVITFSWNYRIITHTRPTIR